MKKDKWKMLSASAIALLALTGTAYGTDLVEFPESRESVPEVQQEESSKDASSKAEESTEKGVNAEEKDSEGADSTEESETQESDEPKAPDSEQETKESVVEEGSEPEETQESAEEETEVEEDVVEEVDEALVVPHAELPLDEETGLLDLPEYHKIAKGRALPRELTTEEKQYFDDYVTNGKFEEVRSGVTDTEYVPIKIYPEDYYITEDGIELKWDKYTLVYSELLPLEEQEDFLASRKATEQDLISQGFVYDKEAGEYVLSLSEEDDALHGIDDANDIDGVVSPDPVGNEGALQEIHYEEKAIFENLAEYDGLTDKAFIDAYGANFLLRGVVPTDGFVQKEFAIGNGLTLAVELESNREEGDNIFLTWGIVKEAIRFDRDFGTDSLGKYNFTTNDLHDFYVEGNVLGTGSSRLRDEGKYTPAKVPVEYTDESGLPHSYLLVADAVLVGEDQRQFSELVGYIEYGWEDIYEDGYETPETPEGETPEGETPDGETPDGETPEGETPTDEEDSDQGNGNETGDTNEDSGNGNDNNTGGNDSDGTGEGGYDSMPDDIKAIDLNKDGVISIEEAIKAGYEKDLPIKKGHPLYDYMVDADEDGMVGDEYAEGNEKFQKTGTAIIWGAIASGLGLGGIGVYLRKKSKKGKEEDSKDDKDE